MITNLDMNDVRKGLQDLYDIIKDSEVTYVEDEDEERLFDLKRYLIMLINEIDGMKKRNSFKDIPPKNGVQLI